MPDDPEVPWWVTAEADLSDQERQDRIRDWQAGYEAGRRAAGWSPGAGAAET